MNSRERLKKTLNHEEPDKVPLDMGGFQTGIHIKAYKRLLDYLEIEDTNIRYYDYLQQLAIPCEKLLKRFEIDTRNIHLPSTFQSLDSRKEVKWDKYIGFWDKFGVFWGRDPEKERLLFNDKFHPFQEFSSEEDIEKFNWPNGGEQTQFDGLEQYAKDLFENTSYALIGRSMGSLFQWSHYYFGFQNALILLLRKPEMIISAMNRLLDYCSDFASEYLKRVGTYIQIVQITDDLSDQKGLMMRPISYKKLLKPIYREFIERIKTYQKGIKINFHCCGSPVKLIPDFIEIGIDSLNPVQIGAYDMEPCSLKERFGEHICFWGGLCDAQKTLPFGTPEEIRKEVRYNMNCLKQNGGYVAANIHNIVYDVPAENIVAMFDAAIEFRDY